MDNDSSPVPAYTPIMRQILDSSVWEADVRARVLWITMLVIASEPGRRGTVDMTLRALAGRACLSPEDTVAALDVLSSPDPTSRTRAEEGRRIVLLDAAGRDWGWRIVNWTHYAEAQKRLHAAVRQARSRDRAKNATTKRVPRGSALRSVTSNPERKGKERKRERGGPPPEGASLSGFPCLGEVEELWSSEGLRGSGERFFRWHSARFWEGIGDWREAARLWSLRERDEGSAPLSDWGAGRPPELDEEARESEETP